MKNNISDVTKESDKKRLIIAKLRIQRSNVFRFGGNSQNDRSRITRCQGKDGKYQNATPKRTGIIYKILLIMYLAIWTMCPFHIAYHKRLLQQAFS